MLGVLVFPLLLFQLELYSIISYTVLLYFCRFMLNCMIYIRLSRICNIWVLSLVNDTILAPKVLLSFYFCFIAYTIPFTTEMTFYIMQLSIFYILSQFITQPWPTADVISVFSILYKLNFSKLPIISLQIISQDSCYAFIVLYKSSAFLCVLC